MKHLTDDQIYILAQKVAAEADLTPEEAENLRHAADCDECYHLLCCMMALQDMTENIGRYAVDRGVPVRERISAVLRLAVRTVNTALDQLESGGWNFRSAPMTLAGTRSAGRRAAGTVKKLADPDNSQTFVAYDAAKQLLMIQVDSADCPEPPQAAILLPDGSRIAVEFEKRAHLFWAEVPGLPEGEYRILMEK